MTLTSTLPVIAIGGIGGSGTRVGAGLLRMLGYYIGDELNEALDNLWFTVLFKRSEILTKSATQFEQLLSLFWSRMINGRLSNAEIDHLSGREFEECTRHARAQHSKDWLETMALSFKERSSTRSEMQAWGWKEPNTHLVIERILHHRSDVKYVHFTRHPFDMAFSSNQNQLVTWGPTLIGSDGSKTPELAVKYWCAVHRSISRLARMWPDRVLMVDFDCLLENPDRYSSIISLFVGLRPSDRISSDFRKFVDPMLPRRGQKSKFALEDFDVGDIEYIKKLKHEV